MKLVAFVVFAYYLFKTFNDMLRNKNILLDIAVLSITGMLMAN